jgi:DNA-directed RNA polymerase subunit M/transcription elongation factor TFIIS
MPRISKTFPATKHDRPHMPSQSLKDARAYSVFVLSKHTTPEISKEIERSIMDYTKKSCELKKAILWSDVQVRRLYIRKLRMILANIRPLLDSVDKKDIALCQSAFVSHQDLRPDIYDPLLYAIQKREQFSILNYADEDEGYEGLLKCGKCGSKRTTYVTLQTRCADEPETVYLKCFACGKNDTIRD